MTRILKHLPQRSESWFAERAGNITGSKCNDLVGTPLAFTGLSYELAGEMNMTPRDDLVDLSPTARGTYLEPEARAGFQLRTGLPVYNVGFVGGEKKLDPSYSPDGLSTDSPLDDITFSVEIKCPMIKNYIKYIIDGGVPKEYIAQCTRPFMVSNTIEKVYFVVYNPEYTPYPMYIYEYMRAEAQPMIAIMTAKEAEMRTLVAGHMEKLQAIIKK